METILTVSGLGKTYLSAGKTLTVLDAINFTVEAGSTNAITGPSGSGKTTLLGLCAGLDSSTTGSIQLKGIELGKLTEDKRASLRNQYIGFIFQNFQLLPTLTALENVMVPLELRNERNIKTRAMQLLDKVGLADRGHHYPAQLSGGEQQRVSLARAFSNRPQLLFADEPTGNLDAETSEKVTDLIFDLNKQEGTTLLLVTHDLDLAGKTGRILRIKGGRLTADDKVQQLS